jgi:hypothetical protein
VHCSVRDLAKFAAYWLAAFKGKDSLLKAETSKRLRPDMWKGKDPPSVSGGTPWLTASYLLLPDQDLVVAVMVNAGEAQPACQAVFQAVREGRLRLGR